MNPGKGNAQVAGCAGMIVMLVVIYIGVEVSDTFSGFLWTIGLATLGTMITGLWVLTKLSAGAEERRQEAIRKLSETSISTTNTVTCINSGITLACDLAGGRLAVVRPGTSVVFIPADLVIKITVNLDGRTIVKIDNLSAAAGGFVGGALAGKTGLLLGILSGKRKRSQKAFLVALQIITGNDAHPMIDVILLEDGSGVDPADPSYRSATVAAERFRNDAERLLRGKR